MASEPRPAQLVIDSGSLTPLLVDVALSEEHEYEAEATDYPVESGSDATDHVRSLPARVTVTGVVSDTPIGDVADIRLVEESGDLPSEIALAKLEEIRDAREPVTILTALKTYENMVMLTLSIVIDKDTGRALRFTATFRQLLIITNERTIVRVAVPRASKKRDLGPRKIDTGPFVGRLRDPDGNTVAVWDDKRKTYVGVQAGEFYGKDLDEDTALSMGAAAGAVALDDNGAYVNSDGNPLVRDVTANGYNNEGKPLYYHTDTRSDWDTANLAFTPPSSDIY